MELEELINKRLEIVNNIKNLTETKEEIEAQIKMIMVQKNLEKFETKNGNIATYKEITCNRLNKSLVEKYVSEEDFEKCFKPSTSTRLTIVSAEEAERRRSGKYA